MTASMSVPTDPATYDILSSELASCQRVAAALGELAAQWQQIMVSLQRARSSIITEPGQCDWEHEKRAEATRDRLRLKDGELHYPKSWSRKTPLGGFAREVAACVRGEYMARRPYSWSHCEVCASGCWPAEWKGNRVSGAVVDGSCECCGGRGCRFERVSSVVNMARG